MPAEEILSGGNTSIVVRSGNTVRRPVGAWTPAVHDLLVHLTSVGFNGSPRVSGVDEVGREILEYVEGEVGTLTPEDPLPRWFGSPEACWTIGRWIRDFQCAQQDFVPDPAKPWRRAAGTVLGTGQVLVHHDVSSYNTVRRSDGSLVVIDWDFTRPGDPIEDIAWAAWLWAPLRAGTWWHAEYGWDTGISTGISTDIDADLGLENLRRDNLDALLEGYGPSADQRRRFARAVEHQMLQHADDLEEMALTDPAFAALVDRDYARTARDDAAWWAHPSVRDALLGNR